MLKFILRKMLNKKWMVLSLLIGNLLLISIAAANPLYTEAVLQRTLSSGFSNYVTENNRYPLTIMIRSTSSNNQQTTIWDQEDAVAAIPDRIDLPLSQNIACYTLESGGSGIASLSTSDMDRDDRKANVTPSAMTGLAEHITLIAGTGMKKEPNEDGSIDVIVSDKAFQNLKLILGETLTYQKLLNGDGEPLKVRIAGIFTNKEASDPYWFRAPQRYVSNVFMDSDLFLEWYHGMNVKGQNFFVTYYQMYDYSALKVQDVNRVADVSAELKEEFSAIKTFTYIDYYSAILSAYQKTDAQVRMTFLVLQVPILILLASFIFMVSRQMLDMEIGEIAVLKSRGASRRQLILVYLTQSGVTALIALVLGIPLGIELVRVLGSANAFLEFVNRRSFHVEMSWKAFAYAGGAALLSIATMVLPVFRHSRVTIVNHKQRKHRKADLPFWQKYFLDFIILGVAVYGLYSFNNQKELLADKVLQGESLDPLLFLSASLFMLGAGLMTLRIIPLLTKVIFLIGRKFWSPALYTSFVRVLRTRKQQGFIMVFLVMTIALGVYNASAARTINNNDEANLRYSIGADIVLQEAWEDNSAMLSDDPTLELEYTEPDFGRYQSLPEIQSLTRVNYSTDGVIRVSKGKITDVTVMGINTREFGETAYFDPSLLPEHWYNYLNAMARTANAVLVSSNFKSEYGYKIGDVISYTYNSSSASVRGIIYGFVDYWPGYAPVVYDLGTDGLYRERQNYLVVGNYSVQQDVWGTLPYQVWIKTNGSSEFIYNFRDENHARFSLLRDTTSELTAQRSSAVLQGTNGILTVGFIVALVLCTVGFLIYWILSIRSRELQFGIFRAMGMSMREIIVMLVNEHIFISAASILGGAVTGKLTANLFMPLIQLAYSSSEYSLPLQIISDPQDMVRLAVIIGIMVIGCLLILGWIIRSMKISQALKLGED